jgi:hypothetical protein
LTGPQWCQKIAEMAEWVKILLSALSGMAVGILLEPFKNWINARLASNRANRAIYHELGRIYFMCRVVVPVPHEADETWDHVIKNLKTGAFDFYYEQRRETLFQVDHWQDIELLYRKMKGTQMSVLDKKKTAAEGVREIGEDFEFSFRTGLISGSRVLWEVSKQSRRLKKYNQAEDVLKPPLSTDAS